MKYTENNIKEYIKCKDDIVYFANTYIKICTFDRSLMNIKLNEEQENVANSFLRNDKTSKLMPRQTGKTTVALIILLHQVIFNEYKTIGIIGWKKSFANDMLHRLYEMYDNLPEFLRVEMQIKNKGNVEFDNGCRIITSGPDVTAFKGRAVNIIYIDESEFVPNIWRIMESIMPCISSMNSKFMALSTTYSGGCIKYE